MTLSCPNGVIDTLDAFGLSLDDDSTLTRLRESNNPKELLYETCTFDEKLFRGPSDKKTFAEYIESNCRDKSNCTIPLTDNEVAITSLLAPVAFESKLE